MAKQTTSDDSAHHPSTVAEIRQTRRALAEQDRALRDEGAANYTAEKAGSPPSRPLSDHERRVSAHVQKLLNGSTPPHLLVPAVSRDAQILAERDAIAYADRHYARQEEDALEREAEQFVAENAAAWRDLCKQIVITAVRLASLEARARGMLDQIQWPVKIAMGRSIGSGFSILGIGNPLLDLRTSALEEGIVTASDLKKAEG